MVKPAEFFEALLPEAKRAAALLGAGPNAVPVILAQWAHESGFEADNWVGHNNYSGLTAGGKSFRRFGSPEEHTRAYVGALTDPNYQWGYGFFVQAARENEDPRTLARLLGASPWSADHYTGDGDRPGQALVDMIHRYGLDQLAVPGLDGIQFGTPMPAPAPGVIWPEPRPAPDPNVSPGVGSGVDTSPSIGTPVTVGPAPSDPKPPDMEWWQRLLLLIAMVLLGLLFMAAAIWGFLKNPPAPASASAAESEGE